MSTMEDKELQKMFAAKRTVEANRRRQEELRNMLSATAAPKSRRLWPVWALSAAACLALLLITLPVLLRSETAAPLLVATATELPTPAETDSTSITSKSSTTSITSTTKKARKAQATPTLLASVEPEEQPREETQEEPLLAQETPPTPSTVQEAVPEESPRIHRRTSTQMICSNCNINNVPSPSTTLQDFLAATFGTEASTPFTLKTIEF